MSKQIIATEKAPGAIGPYNQGTKANGMVFSSGQLPIDMSTGEMPENIAEQTHESLKNVMAIIEAGGLTAKDIVKVTVYLKDMNDFAAMNEVYATFFENEAPARVCVEVARLPKDALVEIDAIACE